MAASEVLSIVYEDSSSLLDALVRSFVSRYGGNYEELRADANSIFIEAYESYDERKGSFFKRVKFVVWMKLLWNLREDLKRWNRFDQGVDCDLLGREDYKSFNVKDFCDGLGPDAEDLVRLVLQAGGFKQGALSNRGRINRGHPRTNAIPNKGSLRTNVNLNKGGAVKRYLRNLGWSAKRIVLTFNEIRKAL